MSEEKDKKNKILFIGHDAGAHGAQILLLNLLNWFKEKQLFPFEILLKSGGPLEDDFGKIAPCRVWDRSPSKQQRLLSFIKGDVRNYQQDIALVYSNTITNGELLEQLAYLSCPVITHIHELENYIHEIGSLRFGKVAKHTNLFIAASKAVKENLVNNHGVQDDKIKVVYSFIPTWQFSDTIISRSRDNILKELSIPSEAFIVGASGTIDWRKNTEFFVQLAAYINKHFSNRLISFLWVGGHATWEIEHDIRTLGLNNIIFVPHVSNTAEYFNCMDVFTLVSRIDPYPLVCLEAASLGKPLICFEKSGGMPEFIESDSGFVVPYLDIESMAERIIELFDNRELAKSLGETGMKKVRERHDIQRAGSELSVIIKDLATFN